MAARHVMLSGFLDELEKIAASHGRMHFPKERSGKRPMSVMTMLKKDAIGALFRKHADSQGNPQDVRGDSVDDPGAARPPRRPGEVPTTNPGNIPQSQKLGGWLKQADPVRSEGPGPIPNGESPFAYQEAVKPKKKGDVPSKDDGNVIDRYDQRDFATTVTGLGQHSTGIGAFNSPAEHT